MAWKCTGLWGYWDGKDAEVGCDLGEWENRALWC